MEIAAQHDSRGILYEGYTGAFKQCIFEDGVIQGRNERYEFRCDANLECCGRTCCIPADTTVPLWLVALFIILGLLALAAILGLLAYLLAKRKPKPKPKKVFRQDLKSSSIRHVDDKDYSALDESATGTGTGTGYGNRAYDRAADLAMMERSNMGSGMGTGRRIHRRSDSDDDMLRGDQNRVPVLPPPRPTHGGYRGPARNSWHEHETYEEEFKEEIEYGGSDDSVSSSRERLHRI